MLVKSHKSGQQLPPHHFFVLCKGNNAGKPLTAPCANCFVVSAATAEDKQLMFWLSFAIWKGRGFEVYLKGSVIPFITIKDYRQAVQSRMKETYPVSVAQVVSAFQAVDEREKCLKEQLKLISQMRLLLFHKFFG